MAFKLLYADPVDLPGLLAVAVNKILEKEDGNFCNMEYFALGSIPGTISMPKQRDEFIEHAGQNYKGATLDGPSIWLSDAGVKKYKQLLSTNKLTPRLRSHDHSRCRTLILFFAYFRQSFASLNHTPIVLFR